MKFYPLLTLLSMLTFTSLAGQSEVIKVISIFQIGDVSFLLRDHQFPRQDSGAYQIHVILSNATLQEQDQLNYKAPHPDAYLSAEQFLVMLNFVQQYNGKIVADPPTLYYEELGEGLRVGVMLGRNPDQKRILLELWKVTRMIDPDDWMDELPLATKFYEQAAVLARRYEMD